MHGPADDSGAGLFVLWTRTTKVCPVDDLGVHGFILDNCVPVVFLGVFVSVQLDCHQRIYWRPETFWSAEYFGSSFTWVTTYSRASVLFLPGGFEKTCNYWWKLTRYSYNFVPPLPQLSWELLPNEED